VINLTGPGGGAWTISRKGDDVAVEPGAPAAAAAVVTSSAHDFVLWGTQRTSWRKACQVQGDDKVVATFLDALNIV
jgi:hypothetical protein